ncbi:DHH family phosphoesterase [bacterium]|nr:DHH family phosphoesterase [bacterium]
MALREQLQAWQERFPGPSLALHDFDADGICAAALYKRSLGGVTQVARSRLNLPALQQPAELIYMLDLSCPEHAPPWSQPTVVIDHHPHPEKLPENLLLLHRADRCSAWLAHELFCGQDSQLEWIAALGILSDLGDSANSPLLQAELQRWGTNPLRQITSLINSAYRADGDCKQALDALMEHDSPSQLLHSSHSSVAYLRECQRKVRKRLGQAKQVPAVKRGQLALVQFQSDCPVQSIIAQIWKARLADRVVLAANLRTDRPEVHLSVRSRGNLNAIEILGRLGLVVRGHSQSAGAVLTPVEWETFLETFYANPH